MSNIPLVLRFAADETMLLPFVTKKLLVPDGMSHLINRGISTLAYYCNVYGNKFQLFIKLKALTKLSLD